MQVDGSPLEVAPRPTTDAEQAVRLAREVYGVEGSVRELGSQQDRNFRIDSAGGRYVVKVANRGWGRPAVEAQNAALLLLAAIGTGFTAPVPVAGLDGALLHEVADGAEQLPRAAPS